MNDLGIRGDIYDLPNGIRDPQIASPFSLTSGFALNPDELEVMKIPELHQNPSFKSHVEKINQSYQQQFSGSREVSYTLKRTLLPWILEECFQLFSEQQYQHRRHQFESFLQAASYWIHDFALYRVYREQQVDLLDFRYRDQNSALVRSFKQAHHERIRYHQYVQLLCFEQRHQLVTALKQLNVGLIVNLPFGVEFRSSDVFFHPDVFDSSLQVGCSPEPHHGYPEQAWGIPAYYERSEALQQYLTARMLWLAQWGDGIFVDHLVGWCGQYVLPMNQTEPSASPRGYFLTQDQQEREQNIRWFLQVVLNTGLTIKGEIAGDYERVAVTRKVVKQFVAEGKNLATMVIPRWESDEQGMKVLREYQESTLMMLETHDTSTLLQFLMNRKGDQDEFETPERILEFSRRILGLPFHLPNVPVPQKALTSRFCRELLRRLAQGSPCKDIVFSISSLISMLSDEYRTSSLQNNINNRPGTSGEIGNEWHNWSFFGPPINTLDSEAAVRESMEELGQRFFKPFDHFHLQSQPADGAHHLQVLYSQPSERAILYHNEEGGWDIWDGPLPGKEQVPLLELVIYNPLDHAFSEFIDIRELVDLDWNGAYFFKDLNGTQDCYCYSTDDLKRNSLYILLQPHQIHHFLVCRK